ncbi:MAG: hypothetical protein OK457_03725 [Thaumarchaeota archaeon]|nr:hypothetical protein [Nitrososphaerota archaeon]
MANTVTVLGSFRMLKVWTKFPVNSDGMPSMWEQDAISVVGYTLCKTFARPLITDSISFPILSNQILWKHIFENKDLRKFVTVAGIEVMKGFEMSEFPQTIQQT